MLDFPSLTRAVECTLSKSFKCWSINLMPDETEWNTKLNVKLKPNSADDHSFENCSESNYIIYHNLLFCSYIFVAIITVILDLQRTVNDIIYKQQQTKKTAIYLKSVSGNICPRQRVPVFLKISMPENEKRCLLSFSFLFSVLIFFCLVLLSALRWAG